MIQIPLAGRCKLSCATQAGTASCRTVGLPGVLLSILETLKYPACLALEKVTVLILRDRKDPISRKSTPALRRKTKPS